MSGDLFGHVPEPPPARTRGGEWEPITTAPKDQRVDLWLAAYEEAGDIASDCWWQADSVIPDWYRIGEDGRPWLAVKLFCHATHWKPAGAPEGPGPDGGPALRTRAFIGDLRDSWPAGMQARIAAYDAAEADGRIKLEDVRRGFDGGYSVVHALDRPEGYDEHADPADFGEPARG